MKIFTNQIPEFQRNELSDLVVSLTKALFDIPGEEERYQQWLEERKANEMKKKSQQ